MENSTMDYICHLKQNLMLCLMWEEIYIQLSLPDNDE